MINFQGTREVITYAQKYISGKTLDLGAGSSKYREIIKQKAQDYVTFDVVPGPNIDVVGDALNTPFGSATFDTVISTQVLEHIEKPWLMVKEIRRILKKNGICVLTAPFLEPYHADPHDYFRYTIEGIRSLFENEGFETIECSSYGQLFSVLAGFIRISWFSHYQKRKLGSWKITHFLEKAAQFLNRFTKNKIIYSDVYMIAKKV